jgi:hypothetical protein
MRKFILIAAMVLVSASAQAGPSRNLTVAANDEVAKVAQPKAVPDKVVQDKTVQDKAATQVDEQGVETPKYVERPAAVAKTVEPAKADQVKTVADKDAAALKAEKKHRREVTASRVISELHRHGIYW